MKYLEFFLKYKEGLGELRINLYRTDTLYYYNGFLFGSHFKFDKTLEHKLPYLMEKCTAFMLYLQSFCQI